MSDGDGVRGGRRGRETDGRRAWIAGAALLASAWLVAPAAAGDVPTVDGVSHDPTFFRVDVDLMRMRPDRARSPGAVLCGMRRRVADDAWAATRFACDPGRGR